MRLPPSACLRAPASARRLVASLAGVVLLGACSSLGEPEPPPDDLAFYCEDGRTVRLLEEHDWNRAVLTTTTERITLLRAEDDTGGDRWVTRTGWEIRIDDDRALLTSPGRAQTRCERGAPWD
jgi:hypothetical protein